MRPGSCELKDYQDRKCPNQLGCETLTNTTDIQQRPQEISASARAKWPRGKGCLLSVLTETETNLKGSRYPQVNSLPGQNSTLSKGGQQSLETQHYECLHTVKHH